MNSSLQVPFGYYTNLIPLGDLNRWLLIHHHPEYVRRLIAWLESKGGYVGVGGGWRSIQPTKAGAAPEGMSFHQNQKYADGFYGAVAVDLVKKNKAVGGRHISPTWADVLPQGSAAAKTWGLHNNVDGEPWHMQPIEIDGYTSWRNNGRPAPRVGYFLPVDTPPPPPPPPLGPINLPSGSPIIRKGASGPEVTEIQKALRIIADGEFGSQTESALKAWQANAGLMPDGIYGPQTATALKAFIAKRGQPVPDPGTNPDIHHPEMGTPPGSPSFKLGATDASTKIDGAAPDGRVSWLQAVIGVGITGTFDASTDGAVKSFQKNSALTVDGVYGTQTAAALADYRGR
jgi:peptidoglycan hydrolase-like protein with peptidoglycan-binding domain